MLVVFVVLLLPMTSYADDESFEGIEITNDSPIFIEDRCYPLTANKKEKTDEDGVFYAFKFAADMGNTRNVYAVMDGYILDIQHDFLWLEDDEGEIQVEYYPQITDAIEWTVSPDDDVEAGDVIGRISNSGMQYQNLYVRFNREYPEEDEPDYFTWDEIYNGEADIEEEMSIYDRWALYTKTLDHDNWEKMIDGFNQIIAFFNGDMDIAGEAINAFTEMNNQMIEYTSFGFNQFKKQLSRERLFGRNTLAMVKKIYIGILPFSIFISILIWYIDVYKKIVFDRDFDSFNKCEVKDIFISLFMISFWVINAFGFCLIILKINSGIVSQVMTNNELIIKPFDMSVVSNADTGNMIGDLIYTTLAWFNNYLSFLMLNFIMLIVSLCLVCKLAVRQIELCCMIPLSSVFFGCMGMKHMKWLFKKFFKSYLFVVMQTIPMAIIYRIGVTWINERMAQLTFSTIDCFIIIIGLGCLLLKKSFIYKIFE